MEPGVIIHKDSDSQATAARWLEGPVEKGWFGYLKVRGKRQLGIETFRCRRCSLLESYAPD
jgi:hypothetical protein